MALENVLLTPVETARFKRFCLLASRCCRHAAKAFEGVEAPQEIKDRLVQTEANKAILWQYAAEQLGTASFQSRLDRFIQQALEEEQSDADSE